MNAAELTVCQRVLRYQRIVDQRAPGHQLDRWLLLGLIAQESQGRPGAQRVERGFWHRYQSGILIDLERAGLMAWADYPDVVAQSYGLCQVLFPVALELGMRLAYPADLCDPETGIEAGCRKLAKCVQETAMAADPTRAALLHYNGGSDPTYPAKVLAWMALLHEETSSTAEGGPR